MSIPLRNIAIIAHVDHGKTTLVDQLLRQSGTLDPKSGETDRIMDSNALERERGITILSKNTAINWEGCRINIVDTPGHADFGGEVERVLSMVDSVLLLVDATDGPMPQTRFVTQKAFAHNLNPIIVVNKIDRGSARPDWVLDQIFDLFIKLGASEAQLDFPVVYTSALLGKAGLAHGALEADLRPLFETIIAKTPAPQVDPAGPLQMQICQLDYNSYVGLIGIGKIHRGTLLAKQPVLVMGDNGTTRTGKIEKVFRYLGLSRHEADSAAAGDIVAITGLTPLRISDTICAPGHLEPCPPLTVDEPTVTVNFCVNTSPFSGKEGKYVTSRQILERLQSEILHNVALRVQETPDPDIFQVAGRGELHLGILIETMRREGYELAVSRPKVIFRTENNEVQEPFEEVILDLEEKDQGTVMETLGLRKGELTNMLPDGKGRVRLDYTIPSRGLIGFRNAFLTMTSGTGVMCSRFTHYGPRKPGILGKRLNGVLISNGTGKALAYSLFSLQERGRLMIEANVEVYEGQIIGLHTRSNDLTVNCLQNKKLTNIRAAGKDTALILSPPIKLTLEQALEFIEDDELVEVTPSSIRVRKKNLTEGDRKRADRTQQG